MKLQPGEVYKPGDPLIFSSWQARENFYHPQGQPTSAIASQPAQVEEAEFDLTKADSLKLAVVREPNETEVLELPMRPFGSPTGNFNGGIQVAGDVYFCREQPSGEVQPALQPKQPKHGKSRPQSSPAPAPMDMAEKLAQMERFALFERNLYMYDAEKGIYRLIDRDDTKSVIINRLAEDLRVRGTANQVRDIYEFLRLDKRLEVVERPPKHLLAFTNGVLNLRTGRFTPRHSSADFLVYRLEIPFVPEDRDCPRFRAVLHQISGGDPVFIARVLEVMAYLLIPSTFIKGIVLFQGLSGTGKSVVARLLASFLDPSMVSHVGANQFNQRFSAATLQGRCLNVAMDLPGGRIGGDAVAFLKQVTGGDEIFVENKGVDGHTAHLDCRFLFGTNHAFVPTIRDEAFMDRIILIPFRYPVPPEEVDTALDDKLLPERPAIFNLLLEAFDRLQRNNYQFTGEDIYGICVAGLGESDADPLMAAFIRECCCFDPNEYVPTSTLFSAYTEFLTSHGQPFAGNCQQFSRLFNTATPSSVTTKRIRAGENTPRCYTGITLKGEYHEKQ